MIFLAVVARRIFMPSVNDGRLYRCHSSSASLVGARPARRPGSTLATARPRCTSKTTKIIMATTMATAISHVALSKDATLDALSKPTDLSDELCPHVCDQPCG